MYTFAHDVEGAFNNLEMDNSDGDLRFFVINCGELPGGEQPSMQNP